MEEKSPPPTDAEKPLVLLRQPLFPEFVAALAGRFRFALVADADAAATAEARVLLVPGLASVSAELVDRLPALELVAATSVGVDHVDLDACRRRGVSVTNAGAAFSIDSADYGVGLVVAVLRRVAAAEAYVRRGRWVADGAYPLATKVSNKRVGIVGLGRIGSLVARRLAAFGATIAYHSRTPKPSVPYKFFPSVRDLAADSDVLLLSCALTEETRHMVNREVMEALGKDGVLINVGRGGLVDEPELVRCLREGVIGGAGLDVYENEPAVPPELFAMDNVVLSDHRAVITPESIRGALDLVAALCHKGKAYPWERELQQEESTAMQDLSRAAATALCRGISVSRPAVADLRRIRAARAVEGDARDGSGELRTRQARGAGRRADLAAEAAARAKDVIFLETARAAGRIYVWTAWRLALFSTELVWMVGPRHTGGGFEPQFFSLQPDQQDDNTVER